MSPIVYPLFEFIGMFLLIILIVQILKRRGSLMTATSRSLTGS